MPSLARFHARNSLKPTDGCTARSGVRGTRHSYCRLTKFTAVTPGLAQPAVEHPLRRLRHRVPARGERPGQAVEAPGAERGLCRGRVGRHVPPFGEHRVGHLDVELDRVRDIAEAHGLMRI